MNQQPEMVKNLKWQKQILYVVLMAGETMLHLAQRIYNLLDEIKQQPDKVYLLVAHNGISRVVNSYFYDMTNEEFAAFGIKTVKLENMSFKLN